MVTSVHKCSVQIMDGQEFTPWKKSKAHEALSLLFSCEGVPPVMIADGSKEQVQGQFRKKLVDADC